jgi:DNA-directed RNA polymerase subunit RPC12/RpoP
MVEEEEEERERERERERESTNQPTKLGTGCCNCSHRRLVKWSGKGRSGVPSLNKDDGRKEEQRTDTQTEKTSSSILSI